MSIPEGETAIGDRAFNEQPGCLDGEWLQEEDISQGRRCGHACYLQVARAREDDAALHHMM